MAKPKAKAPARREDPAPVPEDDKARVAEIAASAFMARPAEPKPKLKVKAKAKPQAAPSPSHDDEEAPVISAPARHPGGRPTKFQEAFVEQARKLAILGATDREAAEFFEVTEATLYLWKHTHPEFSEALKIGKEAADARVEQSLYRRALGYTHDAVKIAVNAQGEVTEVPYVERFAPDTTAAIFWLKNRKPAEWRDVQQVKHSGTISLAALIEESAKPPALPAPDDDVIEG